MGKEKNIIVQRTINGKTDNVKLGSLGLNELCRGIVGLEKENNRLKNALNNAYLAYANHIASQDGMSKEEWMEFINESK